jgi:hypothetical protein
MVAVQRRSSGGGGGSMAFRLRSLPISCAWDIGLGADVTGDMMTSWRVGAEVAIGATPPFGLRFIVPPEDKRESSNNHLRY